MYKIYCLIIILSIVNCQLSIVKAQSIINTVHNLSVSGPGTIKATIETEICVFCHTPHKSAPKTALWNKSLPGINYDLYKSTTEKAVSGQPDGSSILCLSCHDGTVALGNVISRPKPISFSNGITKLPTGKTNITTDLSDDHPVSFTYDAALTSLDLQLKEPSAINLPIKLEKNKVQCTSCHDPHNNVNKKFLIVSNENSALCNYCHQQNYWQNSTHNSSSATWNQSGTNPWQHTPYTTVSQNACENCHNPHNADGKVRLRNYAAEENNCLYCHNGNVASTDIYSQLTKNYKHDVYKYNNIHEPNEDAIVATEHVECEDCHNPHASNSTIATAPNVKGFNLGVTGVNQLGAAVNQAQYEYEICYKCHADSPTKAGPKSPRVIVQNNVKLEFDISNPSFHPVVGQGQNTNVPGLLSPYTVISIIYCSDCHASDGTSSPKGPHGSTYPTILKMQYVTTYPTAESTSSYELCYSCHNRTVLFSTASNFTSTSINESLHKLHVQGKNISCNDCHDPHGISISQVVIPNTNDHLINFNSNAVTSLNGNLYYKSNGSRQGTCYLSCHGSDHSPKSY